MNWLKRLWEAEICEPEPLLPGWQCLVGNVRYATYTRAIKGRVKAMFPPISCSGVSVVAFLLANYATGTGTSTLGA